MERITRSRDIRLLTLEELQDLVKELGQPAFRAKQLNEWIHDKNVCSFDEMTNLPAALREKLSERFSFNVPVELVKQVSKDGSRKYLLQFSDGVSVETVGMPNRNKLAVCISSQAGCAMGCAFCATGLAGLSRSLTAQEMVDQVLHVARDFGERVTSVVFMGQGEPFANFDATVQALRILNDPDGLAIGARHLTVSTCGVIPGIRRFAELPEQFTLAISLHSAIQGTRNQLMPGVKKYTLLRLHEAIQLYVEKTGRRPTYEFAMIDGINDTSPEMQALVDFCAGTLCHVNLIQLNNIPDSPFRPSPIEKVESLQRRLTMHGVETTIRNSRGSDIDAACGQLKQRRFRAQ
ncbi:23S rRNA (adenine(2503)-C(2))-methyltransferase RlmN [Collinsella stercoris]|uniref:Probable dual-specificity RNA methyltransferase RlmN n=1 Tax=Collinsella stercoris DSM 13279 TaxID=445975 RepID=B6GDN5_9ACTN|nr:23S rRNA (adenine(2503)-C(2))-methyltransferase RlmN [Collinsella stercoris]EEA89674.1 23S rRNA m2A2503 methyltransferase [Collinsella stercoris DSM 13279]UEA45158.1 23S rRNA (adenine(2503)-C(2))-methyltransferase RlmN [Collinsella stercoris DSM 13279]UWP12318.1 23S rRNA (adenine(2503)-C(2))-methyltransferase RlmN [Collinsella stercoris]